MSETRESEGARRPVGVRDLAQRLVDNAKVGVGVRLTRDELRQLMKSPVGHTVRSLMLIPGTPAAVEEQDGD